MHSSHAHHTHITHHIPHAHIDITIDQIPPCPLDSRHLLSAAHLPSTSPRLLGLLLLLLLSRGRPAAESAPAAA